MRGKTHKSGGLRGFLVLSMVVVGLGLVVLGQQPGAGNKPGSSSSYPSLPPDFPQSLEQVVALGKDIFLNTDTHPLSKPYVGNRLKCTSCHLNGGTGPLGKEGTLVGSATAYPAYSPREKAVITLQDRIANCFMRSMNGIRPPLGGPVLIALDAYITSLSQDMPMRMNPDKPLGPGAQKPLQVDWKKVNVKRGAELYRTKCASCHGVDGQGVAVFPPVWGPGSYNAGAGLADWQRLAAYLYGAMPFGNPNLSPEEARDIAAFVDSQPRPAFVLREHLPPADALGVYAATVLDEVKTVQPVKP